MKKKAGRHKKQYQYPSQMVRTINNRLYRLEKTKTEAGQSYADISPAYRVYHKSAVSKPNTANGKMWRVNEDTGALRLATKEQFEKMSVAEKRNFIARLNDIWENADSTTNVGNVKASYNKSYQTFMDRYGDEFPELTQSDYAKVWTTYSDVIASNKSDFLSSDQVMSLLQNFNIKRLLDDNQVEEALLHLSRKEAHKIPKEYMMSNY